MRETVKIQTSLFDFFLGMIKPLKLSVKIMWL